MTNICEDDIFTQNQTAVSQFRGCGPRGTHLLSAYITASHRRLSQFILTYSCSQQNQKNRLDLTVSILRYRRYPRIHCVSSKLNKKHGRELLSLQSLIFFVCLLVLVFFLVFFSSFFFFIQQSLEIYHGPKTLLLNINSAS